jgi:hypothetical protein
LCEYNISCVFNFHSIVFVSLLYICTSVGSFPFIQVVDYDTQENRVNEH